MRIKRHDARRSIAWVSRWQLAGVLGMLVLSVIVGQGCGTISHGSRQDVVIQSSPPGALVTIEGFTARTPAKVSLSRTRDYVVSIKQEGYETKQTMVTRSFNGWTTIGGNLLWLLPGIVLDLGTGGAWTLEPDTVHIALANQGDQEKEKEEDE